MTKEEAQELLQRYQEGKLPPEEKVRLEAWFDHLSGSGQWEWTEEEKQELNEELQSRITAATAPPRVRRMDRRILWAAACFLVLFGIGLLAIKYKTQLIDRFNPIEYAETYVPPGSRMTLTLSDGSVVNLNGGSRIKYPKQFNRSTREVSLLEGEAYFTIHPDEKLPFIVEARSTYTTVLGTAFNICAYDFLKDVQVTVTTGKVAVKGITGLNNKETIPEILLPGDQAIIGKLTGNIIKKHVNATDVIGWINGKYKFSDQPLAVIIPVLENAYQVKILCSNTSLNQLRLSSEFEHTDKLEDILFSICKANDLNYTIDKQNILLKENH